MTNTRNLADDCKCVADARERRGKAFAAAGPGLWNSLPPHLRDADLPYSRFLSSGH